jgi:nucleoside-diphosphate-sugar epimerase
VSSALIGYTGFVGGNLCRQRRFDALYNSANIEAVAGQRFELLVCAGTPGEKWRANLAPDRDRASIALLRRALAGVTAETVVLISTVDVYPNPVGVDEHSVIDRSHCHPYGRHRLELEEWVAGRFNALVVRLPGLFGEGLKKNAIFDLAHNHNVDQIHADSVFQFYDLERLWRDLTAALGAGLSLVNFATEPTSIREIARVCFGVDFANRPLRDPVRYDIRSVHAQRLGGRHGYLCSKPEVLERLKAFVERHPFCPI